MAISAVVSTRVVVWSPPGTLIGCERPIRSAALSDSSYGTLLSAVPCTSSVGTSMSSSGWSGSDLACAQHEPRRDVGGQQSPGQIGGL